MNFNSIAQVTIARPKDTFARRKDILASHKDTLAQIHCLQEPKKASNAAQGTASSAMNPARTSAQLIMKSSMSSSILVSPMAEKRETQLLVSPMAENVKPAEYMD
jgi:hypothetical protein